LQDVRIVPDGCKLTRKKSQTISDTPLWQEAAVHQDQNLTPQEQLLPIRYQLYQQGPEPPLTLTLSLPPPDLLRYTNTHLLCIYIQILYIYLYCLHQLHQVKFLVSANLLGNKLVSDSDIFGEGEVFDLDLKCRRLTTAA